MTAMNPGSKQHLDNLCNVFEMPTTAARKDPHGIIGVRVIDSKELLRSIDWFRLMGALMTLV